MKHAFNLPFLQTYKKSKINPLNSKKVSIFLGGNFYMRLNNIYSNICTAIVDNNWKYLSSSLDADLYNQITTQINRIKQNNFKIKSTNPQKIERKKKKIRFIQNQWIGDYTKIAVQSKVLFGQNFPQDQKDIQCSRKIIKLGPCRYLSYRPSLSILSNFKRFYQIQSYQFKVRVQSSLFLQIGGREGEIVSGQNTKQIITQLKLKSGNQGFNWIVCGINNFGKNIL